MDKEEWLRMRKNKIGASDAPIIMGVSPWKKPYDLWLEKMSEDINTYCNQYMNRGIELEPVAREEFNNAIGVFTEPKVLIHKDYEWMMASLDGLSKDGKTIVEIKCPGEKDHKLALEGKVPDKYYPQLQHQMEVAGVDKCYYYSFDGKNGIIVVVNKCEEYIKELIAKEKEFYRCMLEFSPPDDRCNIIEDETWIEISNEWKSINNLITDLNQQLKVLENREKEIKDILVQIGGNNDCKGNGIKLKKCIKKGPVDYSKVEILKDFNLEPYRKKEAVFWKISEVKG